MKCISCGSIINDNDNVCPKCGTSNDNLSSNGGNTKKKKKKFIIFIILFIVFVLIGILYLFVFNKKTSKDILIDGFKEATNKLFIQKVQDCLCNGNIIRGCDLYVGGFSVDNTNINSHIFCNRAIVCGGKAGFFCTDVGKFDCIGVKDLWCLDKPERVSVKGCFDIVAGRQNLDGVFGKNSGGCCTKFACHTDKFVYLFNRDKRTSSVMNGNKFVVFNQTKSAIDRILAGFSSRNNAGYF